MTATIRKLHSDTEARPIESGIPIPRKGGGRPALYPFGEMEIGDSFPLSPDDEYSRVDTAARSYGKRHGMKFTFRTLEDGSRRCWRVA